MQDQKLARHVTIEGKTYGPHDDVPADIAAKITNPKAWIPIDADAVDDEADSRDAGTSAGDKLATTVMVGGRSYGPRDHVPDRIASQIRNPKAWASGTLPTLGEPPADTADDTATGDKGTATAETKPRKAAAKQS